MLLMPPRRRSSFGLLRFVIFILLSSSHSPLSRSHHSSHHQFPANSRVSVRCVLIFFPVLASTFQYFFRFDSFLRQFSSTSFVSRYVYTICSIEISMGAGMHSNRWILSSSTHIFCLKTHFKMHDSDFNLTNFYLQFSHFFLFDIFSKKMFLFFDL